MIWRLPEQGNLLSFGFISSLIVWNFNFNHFSKSGKIMDKDHKSKVQGPLRLRINWLLANKRTVITKSPFLKLLFCNSYDFLTRWIKYKGKLLKNISKMSVLGAPARCFRRCGLRWRGIPENGAGIDPPSFHTAREHPAIRLPILRLQVRLYMNKFQI